jgi:hypothetical protein
MIELISAAKVGKKIEIDVSLLEKVVSNQEKMSGVPMDEHYFRISVISLRFFSLGSSAA